MEALNEAEEADISYLIEPPITDCRGCGLSLLICAYGVLCTFHTIFSYWIENFNFHQINRFLLSPRSFLFSKRDEAILSCSYFSFSLENRTISHFP